MDGERGPMFVVDRDDVQVVSCDGAAAE